MVNLTTGKSGPYVAFDTSSLGLSFNADGTRLTAAAISPLRTMQWQIEADGRLRELRSTPIDVSGSQRTLSAIGLSASPDGRVLAISSPQSETVWLVDADTGQIRDIVNTPGNVRAATFHADGRRMWTLNTRTSNSRSELVLNDWNLFRERLVRTEKNPQRDEANDSPARTTKSRNGERHAKYWPETGKLSVCNRAGHELHSFRITPAAKSSTITVMGREFFFQEAQVAFSPNGRHLMAIPLNGPAKIFDTNTGAEKWSGSGFTGFGIRMFNKSVELSPGGELMALPDTQGFKIVKTDDLTELMNIPTQATNVYFSPDRRRLVTAARIVLPPDKETVPQMSLWDLESRREIQSVPFVPEFVQFSENGRRFVSHQRGANIIWDAETGSRISEFGSGTVNKNGFFNYDGSSYLTFEFDGVANANSIPTVWDTTTGRLRFRLDGLTGSVVAANFSRDGKRIATATRNGLDVKLWDASTGRELLSLTGIPVGRSGAVLYFSDDGFQLTLGNRQGSEVVWDVSPRKDAVK